MESIRKLLKTQCFASDIAIVCSTGAISRKDLDHSVDRWRKSSAGQAMRGERVAVDLHDDLTAILAICRLDGWCKSILLLPRELSHDSKESFVDRAGVSRIYGIAEHACEHFGEVDSSKANDEIETEWCIPTSGTTGTPKLYRYSLERLSKRIKRDSTKGKEFVWGLLYDPFRFAGLQVVLQSIVGGSTLAVPRKRENLMESLLFFQQVDVNAISATPTLWRKILLNGDIARLQLRQITLGGEIVDDGILEALRTKYPNTRIIHIYASTDAGVGFAVSDGKAGFPESFVSTNQPLQPALRVGEDGRLFVKRSDQSPLELSTGRECSEKWIFTGDLVRFENGRYYFRGRENGAINVGGNKVMPEEVELAIRKVPGVIDVKVEGRKNPIVGQVVQATVVRSNGTLLSDGEFKAQILSHCRDHIDSFKVPASIKFVQTLDITNQGKLRR